MSGPALEVREAGARYIVQGTLPLIREFELMATAPGGIAKLRELVLSLAVQGRLVSHLSHDEPAETLLQRLSALRCTVTHANRDQTSDGAPYELPCGWAWAAFGDLVENMGSGWSPACDEGERSEVDRWAVLKTTAVQVMQYRPNEHKALPVKLNPRPNIEVKPGDVLVTRAGPMNRVGISCAVGETPERLMLSDKIVRAHPIGDEMLASFVVLALNAGWSKVQIEIAKTGMAASQVNISQSDLKAIPVPVCSQTEQHRIVARVEELMKLCDTLEQSGRLADEQHARLTSTLFDALVASESAHALAENWQRIAEHFDLLLDRPEAIAALEQTILQLAVRGLLVPQDSRDALDDGAAVSLGDAGSIRNEADDVNPELPTSWSRVSLGSITRDLRYGTSAKCAYESVGAPVLRIPNLCSGRVLVSDLKFGALSADEVRRLRLEVGDLLIIRSNGSASLVGSAAIVGKEAYGFAFAGYLMRLRLREEWATPSFVLLTLETAAVRSQIERPLRTTSGVKNINSTEVANIRLSLPPLAEQHRIVARVEELRLLCTQLRERLSAARRTQSQLADALVAEVLA